jgi:prepilin peptidase CpaA
VQTIGSLVALAALVLFCAAAVVFDLRSGRIPNVVNASGLVTGAAVSFAWGGRRALAGSLFGAALGLAIMVLPFLLHMVGGGDVKFLAAAGSLVGWQVLLPSFLLGAALGGVVGAVMLVLRDRSAARLQATAVLLLAGSWRSGPPSACRTAGRAAGPLMAYAVPLSIGLVTVTSLCLCLR